MIQFPNELTSIHEVPFVIWCYWEGAAMDNNRLESFNLLKAHIEVPICLLTPQNIHHFELAEHPFHAALSYLSIVHRSDYIRAYMMHHYGGGWHDIKATRMSFAECWNAFEDPTVYLIGRPESYNGAAKVYDEAGLYMPDYWADLVSVPAWIARGHSPLSLQIISQMEAYLDTQLPILIKHPAKHPREKYIAPKHLLHYLFIRIKHFYSKRNPYYPIPWTLFGNIYHPAVYAFREHVSDKLPQDSIKNAGIYHRS